MLHITNSSYHWEEQLLCGSSEGNLKCGVLVIGEEVFAVSYQTGEVLALGIKNVTQAKEFRL